MDVEEERRKVGRNLRAIREAQRVSRETLARSVGCSPDKIEEIEGGFVPINEPMLKEIAAKLGVPTGSLWDPGECPIRTANSQMVTRALLKRDIPRSYHEGILAEARLEEQVIMSSHKIDKILDDLVWVLHTKRWADRTNRNFDVLAKTPEQRAALVRRIGVWIIDLLNGSLTALSRLQKEDLLRTFAADGAYERRGDDLGDLRHLTDEELLEIYENFDPRPPGFPLIES